MPLIKFTRNHEDLSTDRGYQFKFFCDKCGNGYETKFETSAVGLAGTALQTLGQFFGGVLGRASCIHARLRCLAAKVVEKRRPVQVHSTPDCG